MKIQKLLLVASLLSNLLLPFPVWAKVKLEQRTFMSHVTNAPDHFLLVRPTAPKPVGGYTLVVYLHGMGSNTMEPINYPNELPVVEAICKQFPSVIFISCPYGGEASWGIDPALADISDNIRQVEGEFPTGKVIMMGSSMGGCTVLNFTATAPPDIKKKITGIVAVEASGDLAELYEVTGYKEVQPSLEKAFGGSPSDYPVIYRKKSFLRNIPLLRPGIKIFLVSARSDTTVPPHFQHELFDSLTARNIPVKLDPIEGAHGVPPASNYITGLKYVLE